MLAVYLVTMKESDHEVSGTGPEPKRSPMMEVRESRLLYKQDLARTCQVSDLEFFRDKITLFSFYSLDSVTVYTILAWKNLYLGQDSWQDLDQDSWQNLNQDSFFFKILIKILGRILTKILVKILIKILDRISTKILGKILTKILDKILTCCNWGLIDIFRRVGDIHLFMEESDDEVSEICVEETSPVMQAKVKFLNVPNQVFFQSHISQLSP